MKKPELVRRNKALLKTQKRFVGKHFKIGSNDCVKLAAFHLRAMGHRPPSTGHYKTAAEGVKQLKKTGHRTLKGVLDKLLEEIPPASMLPGDIALVKSDPDAPASKIGTIMVLAGGRKFLGWHPDHEPLAVMELLEIEKAWRV